MLIHGHKIEGDAVGLHYLENLREDESQVLFDEAKMRGKARFMYMNKHYEVVRTSAGSYVVTDIHSTGGIF